MGNEVEAKELEKQEAEARAAAEAEATAAVAAFTAVAKGEAPPAHAEAAPATPAPGESPASDAAEATEESAKARKAREAREEQEWLDAAPAGLRDLIKDLPALATRVRNAEGHIGGLKSAQGELKTMLEASGKAADDAAAAGKPAPSAAQVAAAAGSGEKWKQMKEDFPDWAEALEERLAGLPSPAGGSEEFRKKLEGHVATVVSDAVTAMRMERVEEAHEGWEQLVKTPEFSAWLGKQPENVASLRFSDKPKDAISLLDKFKADRAAEAKPPQKDDRLAAAVQPTKGRTVTRPEAETEASAAAKAFARVRTGTG